MRKLFFVLTLVALTLAACSRATPTPIIPASSNLPKHPTPSPAELEITNPAKPIEVTAGSEFTITVRVDLSPDYHWEVGQALDTRFVDYVWKDFVPDTPDASTGRDVWRFKAIGRGTTTITLGYYQGMTENFAQMPTFTVVVK